MTDKILKAKQTQHQGRMFGCISNGGSFNVGNLEINIVANGSKFVTVQVFEYGLDETPAKQTWVKTKRVVEKVEVQKKEEQEEAQTKIHETVEW